MDPSHERLKLHHFLPGSRANGPGLRAVVWLQGCTLGCPGCFNPHTHPAAGGNWVAVEQLFNQIMALQRDIQGVTISGGEPLQQFRPLLRMLQRLRDESPLSVLLFSGYSWNEIQQMPQAQRLTALVDVLIAGRYEQSQPTDHGLLASSNQSAHFFSQRYSIKDLEQVPAAEVILTPQGETLLSGVHPLGVG